MQIQGVGAHTWVLARRNGLARGIFYLWVADDRFSEIQIVAGAQSCLNAFSPGGGYSAYHLVFGTNPVDLLGRGNCKEADLLFAQQTSPSGQVAQQRKERKMAQGAALEEVASNKLRRLLE